MASFHIVKYGDPILRMKAAPVREINGSIHQLIEDMIETMRQHEGVGLAAPQIAESKAIFVIDLSLIENDGQPMAIINPKIVGVNGESVLEEGCLSVPGIREDVKRPEVIQVNYQDLEGYLHEEEISGLKARVFQHEIDHLNGILFVDRLGPMKRKLLRKQLKQIVDEELEKIK